MTGGLFMFISGNYWRYSLLPSLVWASRFASSTILVYYAVGRGCFLPSVSKCVAAQWAMSERDRASLVRVIRVIYIDHSSYASMPTNYVLQFFLSSCIVYEHSESPSRHAIRSHVVGRVLTCLARASNCSSKIAGSFICIGYALGLRPCTARLHLDSKTLAAR